MKRTSVVSMAFRLLLLTAGLTPASAQIEAPQFSKAALLNGMEVFFLPASGERCRFLLLIQNGAAFDPVDKWGVTELTTRMMMEQTARRTGEQLRQDLALLGAELDVRVEWDAIYFSGSAPAERLGDALNVLAEIVVRPDFREEVFERVRQDLLAEARRRSDSVAARTQEIFLSRLFQQNPYGHTVDGNAETLQALLLNDVKIQYRRLFLPNQAQLAVYAPADHTPLFRTLARSWGSWVRGEAAPFTFRRAERLDRPSVVIVAAPAAAPGLMRIGGLTTARNHPEFFELEVLRHYLTLCLPDWAMEVTSQSQIRASVKLEAGRMPGFLQLTMQAPADQLVRYADKFRDTLTEIEAGNIQPERFKEAKELAFLELRRRMEDPASRLRQLLETQMHGLGVSFITTYGIRLDRVQPARLQEAVRDLLPPSSLLLVGAGDAGFLKGELDRWGDVAILN